MALLIGLMSTPALADPPPTARFVMTGGLTLTVPISESSSFTAIGGDFRQPSFTNVSFAAGAELLAGRLALMLSSTFAFQSSLDTTVSMQQDVNGDDAGAANGPFTTTVEHFAWSWSLGIDTRYNFMAPKAQTLVPYVSVLVGYGQAFSDRDTMSDHPDEQDLLIADNLEIRNRIQAGLSFGLEYLFTDSIGLGLDVDLAYTASFWSGERESDRARDGPESEEGDRTVETSTFDTVSHSMTWGGQLFVSFRY